MSAKKCLCPKDHTKIKNAVDKNKPMSMPKQKMAEKQEKMFSDLNKNPNFQKSLAGLNKSKTVTAIQEQYAQNGVIVTRSKIKKMMNNGVTVIKPSTIKPSSIPKAKSTKGSTTSAFQTVSMDLTPPIRRVVPPISKVTPISRMPSEKGAARFISTKNQKTYDKYYDEFMNDGKLLTTKQFKDKWDSTMSSEMRTAVRSWKVGTDKVSVIGLKKKAEKLEIGNLKTIIRKNYSASDLKKIINAEKAIGDDAYIKMRALSQSYFDKTGVRKVTLYRGTDGKTGKKLAKQIKEMQKSGKKTTIIHDNSLSGYTADAQTADGFGPYRGGITVRVKFDSKDVLLPHDLWPKSKFADESEFMCIGGNRTVSLKDIALKAGQW